MEDNKKEYQIIGKVEIGTDEYRDLIEGKAEAKQKAEDYMSKWWKEESEHNTTKKAYESLKKNANDMLNFIKENEDIMKKYESYLAQLKADRESLSEIIDF